MEMVSSAIVITGLYQLQCGFTTASKGRQQIPLTIEAGRWRSKTKDTAQSPTSLGSFCRGSIWVSSLFSSVTRDSSDGIKL
ncbi:uncharacterized protein BDCG_17428 [Blastomyces dermatitidis ER-3]|uniref:Uncharacterized protein n=2 Tax=Ajellomyces dermatitidis TaxID=5039 RepID=A0A0J9HED7_AJEDA|nr:uncharacterized protein BDCG_17428 [Blastomyces dermatitidis ER-3]KMW67449.1 hypothetical protein BDDG_12126 [Blastomyces dermatitidis ATCC 18188]OAT02186.1 hypothetical protein BDCG_17428 [Blastomyces dermatitidis ER-3]